MQGKTHELVGVAFGVGAAMIGIGLQNTGEVPVFPAKMLMIAGSILGSLVPDIDHTHSTVSKKVPFFAYPIYAINRIFTFLKNSTSGTLKKIFGWLAGIFGHRGICHWGILWLCLFGLAYFNPPSFPKYICLGLTIGGLSHLVADTLNPSGVPWIIPSKMGRVSLMRISTGSKAEMVFRTIMLVADIALLFLFVKGVLN